MTASDIDQRTRRAYDRYEVWAPRARAVTIRVDGVEHPMRSAPDGWFTLPDVEAVPGARYAFRLEDAELW
ncbi:MAG: malto-oligosyltrehalose trehalohydrolase, partial [Brachybacterium tyrofermentans]